MLARYDSALQIPKEDVATGKLGRERGRHRLQEDRRSKHRMPACAGQAQPSISSVLLSFSICMVARM